ncbi:MAG: ABC transporter substrate-binding protein, partial [Armatimonadetes bacterium]|nr:ABC transporter substrate-binding protein [Armatimonadota bacterium]
MRRTWWALTAVAVALVVLASVSPPARSQGAGVLRTYTISDVTMNPFTLPQQLATLLVIKPVFDTLTRYRPKDLQPVPGLAASWEASEGGRIWTFKLRKGVKWHDGRPFTAHDVKFTFEGIVNPRVRSLFKAPFRGMQRVEVVDDSTVRVVFEQPNVAFPIALGYNIPIAPRHLLEGKDLNTMPEFVQRPIGTGPFRWKEYVRGSHVVLEANPEYFEGRPKMDTLVFKILPDINTVVAQLRTGELDIGVIEPVHKKALTAVPHLNFLTTDLPSTFYIAMNNSRWQFSDKRVRKALTMAI